VHALTILLLAAALVLYGLGLQRLWRRAGRGRGISFKDVASFMLGWLVAAVALFSPLEHAAERLLWTHTVQHELLMVVAAPLIALGRPLEAWSCIVPLRAPRLLSDPLFAWALHALGVWAWHAPALFLAALGNEWLHLAQHASFFLPATLFWWSVFAGRPLISLVLLFGTMMHAGALGFLMAFSGTPWYTGYALDDQRLAGLLMWLPAGTAYPAAALVILMRPLRKWAT
jgi:putative membrane protein